MAANLRRHERKPVAVEIHARDAHGVGQLLFTSQDLSAGGTFLKSELLLEQAEMMSLELVLPGRAVTAQARVAWVRRFPVEGEPAGMGVEFVAMGEADRQALSDYLRSPEAQGEPTPEPVT